jgi:hypothetical protein
MLRGRSADHRAASFFRRSVNEKSAIKAAIEEFRIEPQQHGRLIAQGQD